MVSSPVDGRVRRIVPDPRRPGEVRVHLEGGLLATVPAEAVAAAGVVVGQDLTGAQRDELGAAADRLAAWRTALRCLERRPYAARDLARRLVQKGHPSEAANGAVARAVAAGLVDDERYARHFIETRFARGRGPARLRRELTQSGIPSTLVDRLLEEALPPEQVDDRMQALARKRAGQLRHVDPDRRFQRVVGYLGRRGFRGRGVVDLVRRVVDQQQA